jgi:CheY-like chemotaxis protein
MRGLMARRHETIGEHLERSGVSRREFILFCAKLMVAAPAGLALTGQARASDVAREVAKARRLPVVWLHFQDCTGCTETLLRTSAPDLATLILHVISLDYHETLMAAAGKAAEAALRSSMKANAGEYVLVVDDYPDVRRLVVQLLATMGVEARQAANGKQALDMIGEETPRAIVLDLMMPVMSGFAMLTQLYNRKPGRTIPVILLSGVADSSQMKMLPGVVGVLKKGTFSVEDLRALLLRALGEKQVEKQAEKSGDADLAEKSDQKSVIGDQ